jgi:hypothetical protein
MSTMVINELAKAYSPITDNALVNLKALIFVPKNALAPIDWSKLSSPIIKLFSERSLNVSAAIDVTVSCSVTLVGYPE